MRTYITVLDYNDGEVYRYEVHGLDQHEEYEEFLTEEGHSLSNIEWMSHKEDTLIRKQ